MNLKLKIFSVTFLGVSSVVYSGMLDYEMENVVSTHTQEGERDYLFVVEISTVATLFCFGSVS